MGVWKPASSKQNKTKYWLAFGIPLFSTAEELVKRIPSRWVSHGVTVTLNSYLNYKVFLWNSCSSLSARDISLSLENNEATANNCIFTLPLACIYNTCWKPAIPQTREIPKLRLCHGLELHWDQLCEDICTLQWGTIRTKIHQWFEVDRSNSCYLQLSIWRYMFQRLEPIRVLKMLPSHHSLQFGILRSTEINTRFNTCRAINCQSSWRAMHTFNCSWCKVESVPVRSHSKNSEAATC